MTNEKEYLCEGQYIQINFRNCRCKCPRMQIPTSSAMVSLQNINTFFVALSNFTYFLFWQILNTSIVLLSNFPHSTFFWQILHTSVTIFHMISSSPGGGCPPLDPDIHVDLCQLFTWPHSAFPHCDIITSTPFYFGLKVWIIAIKKNISRSWLECIPPLWLGCWLLVRMNKFMRFSKAFLPTYTTRAPLSSTYLTYPAQSLILNVVQMYTALQGPLSTYSIYLMLQAA